MQFKVGQKLTIIQISNALAHTVKDEITVVSVLPEPQPLPSYVNGPVTAHSYGTMKLRGKRKIYRLDIRTEALVFDGWDIPVKIDREVANPMGGFSFSGNACFNLGGDPALLKDWIENKALNRPVPDHVKGKIVVVPVGEDGFRKDGERDGTLLYPEIRIHGHAVIDRIRARAAA